MNGPVISIFRNKIPLLVFIGILIIPLLYGVLYLWAFWDPYGKLDQLPVAVVNEDVGAVKEKDGVSTWYRFGDDIEQSLADEGGLRWNFVDGQTASRGIENKTYYSMLVIPKRFSEQILSVDSDHPTHAVLTYTTREASGFMAAKFATSAYTKIQQNVNATIAKKYFDNIFIDIRDSAKDLSKAVDGTNDLHDGISSAADGSQQLYDGTSVARDGAKTLYTGLSDLHAGSETLRDGIYDIATGSAALSSNIYVAYEGAESLATGSATLLAGMQTTSGGLASLLGGVTQLTSSATSLQSGSASVSASLTSLASAGTSLQQLLLAYSAENPTASNSATFQQLQALASTIVSGMTQISVASTMVTEGQQQLTVGLNTVQTNVSAVSAGSTSLVSGAASLQSGITTIQDGLSSLYAGSQTLVHGANTAKDGSVILTDKLAEAEKGSQTLWDGIVQLFDGQNALVSGLKTIEDGIFKLHDTLAEAMVKATNQTEEQKNAQQETVMSEPVQLENNSIALVENNGTGFTPYFVPLALWVGIMALFFFFSPEVAGRHTWKNLFEKLSAIGVIGVIQSVILIIVLVISLGLKVRYLGMFFLFLALLSFCYGSLQFFLNYVGKDIGKFLGILILMLQLTTSAGSYPLETIPSFLQTLHPYLPMTYAVDALREIISGGSMVIICIQLRKIVLMTIVFTVASSVLWMKKELHPTKKGVICRRSARN